MHPETTTAHGHAEAADPRGTDRPDDRPGVPMEAEPAPADGASRAGPSRQRGGDRHLHRAGLDETTPVFGTGQPPRGVSGLLRRAAYQVPEHYARHWAMLLLADRIDVVEDRIGEVVSGPLEKAGWTQGARIARENPLPALAGVVAGAWIVKKML